MNNNNDDDAGRKVYALQSHRDILCPQQKDEINTQKCDNKNGAEKSF